ncbi:1-deoxy-D-xylulose-5-phosphate reductoisomerase [Methylophilus medardicus]|uniref:1-deoxy-D-xylulose 5-phosphate reductoisomerase n=1 Tax=Methylophilus medardicus TaxID=2588534 RepID=A0A5B8CRW5_9PROT|nr:1-deoxy-D-xylulose-5-phosphate reductoisomerase [Methylophilus medardicus]QDC43860.1 1-deoxy-D-xylulose-5-phosphate reductoisomerase [Methylophilus medardicus]QDC48867.1 1-deoxy-D-xylulose-5-phosphate reductoisomerase [Methylophilus medardicus]QDC52572.1 1-deoxy-D-xylulose-5-phosphate reductoisomerase [Methylophilus medardicus]
MQYVTILGSTGTIGQQTLDVISQHPGRYGVFALTAHHNVNAMLQQCAQYQPRYAVMQDEDAAQLLRARMQAEQLNVEVLAGVDGLTEVAAHPEVAVVMAAIVGAAGLLPALAAAKAGKKILLANKETLVMAGQLFMDAVKQGQATLLPIDSEHNAIFQVMPKHAYNDLSDVGVNQIILTASGGPFRGYTHAQLQDVTPALALKHPNWVMGAKITIDSSTLMNKGLEVIEAHWLFNARPEQIEVVVHPQSVIHSMVSYVDGSILAQLGNPDMRTPIAYGLAYPERITSGVKPLSLLDIAKLEFEAPDTVRFPCLRLAYDALAAGGTAPAILNAANEVAVAAFLNDQIRYLDIPRLLEEALQHIVAAPVQSIEQLLTVDAQARALLTQLISNLPTTPLRKAVSA